MPYDTLDSLPESVQKLPKHAQEIYRAAFNSAWAEYGGDEAKCHAIAWAAVKRKYEKTPEGEWVEKSQAVMSKAFAFEVPLEKAWTAPDGALRWRCVASSGAVDAQGQRMTKAALEQMASPEEPVIVQVTSHRERPEKACGEVTSLRLDGDLLVAEGILYPWVPEAVTMHRQMSAGIRDYAVSVGGTCTSTGRHFDQTLGKARSDIVSARLEHLFFCQPGEARNPDTFVEALEKALTDDDQEALEMSTSSFAVNVAEAQSEKEAEVAAYVTADMLDPLNQAIGHILVLDISNPEKRALIEKAMQEFSDELCRRLWIEQPSEPLTMANPDGEGGSAMQPTETPPETPEEQPTPPAEEVEPIVEEQETEGELVETETQDEAAETESDAPEEAAPTENGAEEEEPSDDEASSDEASEPEAPTTAEPDAAPQEDLEKAELLERLEAAEAEIARLKAMPMAGGPVSTAANDNTERLDKADAPPERPFTAAVDQAREQLGTAEGEQARRSAHGLFVDAVALQ